MNLPAAPAQRLPAWLWPAIKWGLFALVLWSVSRQAWQMGHSIEDQPTWGLRISPRLPPQPLALTLGSGLAACLAGLP